MERVTILCPDIAEHMLQVHGVDASDTIWKNAFALWTAFSKDKAGASSAGIPGFCARRAKKNL